jgi:hypothetical protein
MYHIFYLICYAQSEFAYPRQDIHAKLSPGLPWKTSIQRDGNSFDEQIGLEFKEETSETLRLEHSFVRCRKMDTAQGRSKTP